jgi:thiamine biosynthesis lipoprotein
MWFTKGISLEKKRRPDKKALLMRQAFVMGVLNEIMITGASRREGERILDEAVGILTEIDQNMSPYKSASEISRINQKAFHEPQRVSRETFDLIRTSVGFFWRSGGAFDITALPLLKLWGFYQGEPQVPGLEKVLRTLAHVGSCFLVLDEEKSSVGFLRPWMGLELGGIGKGYACDRVVGHLKSRGVPGALVNVGGNIFAYGKAPSGAPWRVGLRDPRNSGGISAEIDLAEEAVSTSGDYENYFIWEGRRFPHLLDPRTGFPVSGSVAVSVIAPSGLLADALSTAFFVLGPEKTPSLACHFPAVRWHFTYADPHGRLQRLSSWA